MESGFWGFTLRQCTTAEPKGLFPAGGTLHFRGTVGKSGEGFESTARPHMRDELITCSADG